MQPPPHNSSAPPQYTSRNKTRPAAAALLAMLVFALSVNMLPSVILRASTDLNVTPQLLAVFQSIQFVSFFCAAAFAGLLAEWFGKKRTFGTACILLIAGSFFWANATSLQHVCLATVLWGISGGILEGMGAALLCELYPERRKFYMNVSQILYTVGAVGGPWVAGLLLPRGFPWRHLFSGVGVWGVILLLLFATSIMPPSAPVARSSSFRIRRALLSWRFAALFISLYLYVLVETCIAVYANLYLREIHQAPENWAIYSISLFWLCMMVGRGLCALLPERQSYEKVIASLLTVSSLGLLLQGIAGTWRISLAVFALTGFLFSGTWPLIVALVSERGRENQTSLVSLAIAIGSLGCITAPPLMNAMLSSLPGRAVFMILAIPLLAAATLVLWRPPDLTQSSGES